MISNWKLIIQSTIKSTLPYWISYLLLIWIIRISEFIQFESIFIDYSWSYFLQGFFFDFWFALLSITFLLIFQLIIAIFSQKASLFFFHIFSLALVGIQAGISQYFILMQVPLDSSVYFLSWNDLTSVINLANYIDFFTITIVLSGIAIYFTAAHLLKFIRIKLVYLIPILIIACIASPFSIYYSKIQSKTMSMNNHLNFFVHKSIEHFRSVHLQKNQDLIEPEDFKALDKRFFNNSENLYWDYPFVKETNQNNTFASQFNLNESDPPNVVLILIESLNSYFVDEKSDYFMEIMPFLTSLSKKSLFFPNTLSTGERTLNVLPSTLASLPIAAENTSPMDLDPFPIHYSLPSLLNNTYYSRFYCGVNLDYSNMRGFMNHNKTDYLVGNWEKEFQKMNGEYYHDGDIFKKSWVDLEKNNIKGNRLDVFLTFNTHEPFLYPNRKEYGKKIKEIMKTSILPAEIKTHIIRNKEKFGAYSYLDDQLKTYFKEAEKKPQHKNTIYLIVGDHGSEICLFEPTSRFHTSLIVYSPLLKKPRVSNAVVSHLDIPPSIVSILKKYPVLKLPDQTPFAGKPLNVSPSFSCDQFFPFKANNLSLSGLMFGDYFLDQGVLYRIKNQLKATPINDPSKLEYLIQQLDLYRKLSTYCFKQNQIIDYSSARNHITIDQLFPFYLMNQSYPDSKFIDDEYIAVGEVPIIPLKNKILDITIEIDIEGKELFSEKDLPPFIYNFYDEMNNEIKHLFYKSVRPKLKMKFNQNGVNTLFYNSRVQLNDFKRTKETIFHFYLLNTNRKKYKISRALITMKSDQKTN